MRLAVLCSSPYSETGCAVAARLVQLGHIPVGALTLPSWDRNTLLRKVGQWGVKNSFRYAVAKLAPGKPNTSSRIRNPYLESALRNREGIFRSVHELAAVAGFPVATCASQNSPHAIAQLRQWSPDLLIFTGGNILKDEILSVPRLGVLNSHLALLPEIRGMSSPEWSLLCNIPLGITIHFMDASIDTGRILIRRQFVPATDCESFPDLRNRMIAEGVELISQAVAGLAQGTLAPAPQPDCEKDHQYFVMHDQLKVLAARRLHQILPRPVAALNTHQSGGHNG